MAAASHRGRLTRCACLVACAWVVFPLAAGAGNSDILTINATVAGVCRFQSTTATLNLANSGTAIDPSIATVATGNVNLLYNCTRGQAPSFTYAVGAGVFSAIRPNNITLTCPVASCPFGADTMTSALTWTLPAPTTGAGFSAAGNRTIGLAATVTRANFRNKTVGGPYTNRVTVAVLP